MVSDPLLVRGVAVRVHEGDGDGLHALGLESVHDRVQLRRLQRREDLTVPADSLPDGPPQVPGDQGLSPPGREVVHVIPLLSAGLQDVAEPLGRDESNPDSLPLQKQVRHHRRPVCDL